MTRRTLQLSLVASLCLALLFCFAACSGEKKADEGTKDAADQKADTTPEEGAQPKIVAVEGNFNFGKVKQGTSVEHVFKIKNEGKGDLKIEKARGS